MGRINRRQAIQGAAATAVATTLGTPSVHAQKDQQTLRFVPHVDLKILDPFGRPPTSPETTAILSTTPYLARMRAYRSNRRWSVGRRCRPMA